MARGKQKVKLECGHTVTVGEGGAYLSWAHGDGPAECLVDCVECPVDADGRVVARKVEKWPQVAAGVVMMAWETTEKRSWGYGSVGARIGVGEDWAFGGAVRVVNLAWQYSMDRAGEGPWEAYAAYLEERRSAFGPDGVGAEWWYGLAGKLEALGVGSYGATAGWVLELLELCGARWGMGVEGRAALVDARIAVLMAEAAAVGEDLRRWEAEQLATAQVPTWRPAERPAWLVRAPKVEEEVAEEVAVA